ncbi:MAG: MraY family glycosyltransferase [Candidatus Atribacteria bacterium]|nr:MraY family glycosyltransferase [Candidatus Atribacteria bacterium]
MSRVLLFCFVSFLISYTLTPLVSFFCRKKPPFFLLGLAIIFATGLLDDFFKLTPKMKLFGQMVGALFLIYGGVVIQFVTLPWDTLFYIGYWGIPITFVWIIGISNAMNLIDGMDGLSSGITAIAACTLAIIALQKGRVESATLSFLLVSSVLGFLPYNLPPAKIFIGDGGALFLGTILATISVEGALKSATTFTLGVPILILGVPIFDTIFAIIRRKKNGIPITSPDRGHLHHRLLERGLSQKEVVLIVYTISLSFGVSAILIDRFLANSTYSLLLFLLLFSVFWRWGKYLGVLEISSGKKSTQKV